MCVYTGAGGLEGWGHLCLAKNFCGQIEWSKDETCDPILEEPDLVEFEVCVFTLGVTGVGPFVPGSEFLWPSGMV